MAKTLAAPPICFRCRPAGTPGSVITDAWYNDPSNGGPGASGNEVATFGNTAVGSTSSFSYSPLTANLTHPDVGKFSMSETFGYNLANNGELTVNGQTDISSLAVPEPASIAMLLVGMLGMTLVRRQRHS